jgi:hypothetical protein
MDRLLVKMNNIDGPPNNRLWVIHCAIEEPRLMFDLDGMGKTLEGFPAIINQLDTESTGT